MNFIRVHNADCGGNPVLVNLDQVTEITQTMISDNDSGATIFFNTDVDGLRLNTSESFEQLANALEPAPVVVKRTLGKESDIIRNFLKTLRKTAKAWHGDNKTVTSSFCGNCPIAGIIFPCETILRLHDEDIEHLVEVYAAEKEREVNR